MTTGRPLNDIERELYGKQSRLIREMEERGACAVAQQLAQTVIQNERRRRGTPEAVTTSNYKRV